MKNTKRERVLLIAGLLAIVLYVVCAIMGEIDFKPAPAIGGGLGMAFIIAVWALVIKLRKPRGKD